MMHGSLVTLYKPTNKQIDLLLHLPTVCPTVVAVDNSPMPDLQMHDRLRARHIAVVANRNLGGIGGAFNAGIRLLIEKHCDVFFIFDQDSHIPNDYFERMGQACEAIDDTRFLVGPRIFNLNFSRDLPLFIFRRASAQITRIKVHDKGLLPCSVIISSGTAVSLDAYLTLGGFREDLFIDHVDTEYCMRAQARGVPVYVNADVSLPHELGQRPARIRWPRVEMYDQSALRHYYAARNCIHVARDYWRRCPASLLINLLTLKHLAFILINGENKLRKLSAIMSGVTDGLRGRYGRI